MSNQALISSLTETLSNMKAARARMERVLSGTPFVIRLSVAFYLTEKDGKYRGGHILEALQYTPERAPGAAQHCRENSDGVFPDAQKVGYCQALDEEIKATSELIELLARLDAKAVETA